MQRNRETEKWTSSGLSVSSKVLMANSLYPSVPSTEKFFWQRLSSLPSRILLPPFPESNYLLAFSPLRTFSKCHIFILNSVNPFLMFLRTCKHPPLGLLDRSHFHLIVWLRCPCQCQLNSTASSLLRSGYCWKIRCPFRRRYLSNSASLLIPVFLHS